MVQENDALHQAMHQTEKDTIDVITYLKREDHTKEQQIEKLQNQMKEQRRDQRKETEKIVRFHNFLYNLLSFWSSHFLILYIDLVSKHV